MQNGQNLKKTAYDFIVQSIVSGPLKAGRIVDIDSVAEKLNISRTPVKEALIELQGEGLICRQGRYYTVFLMSGNDIISLYETREVLEAQAARFAAIRATDSDLREMGDLIITITEMSKRRKKDSVLLSDLNGDFHSLVARASKNEYLERYSKEIRLKLKVVRASLYASLDRVEMEVIEHTEIYHAIARHDPEASWNIMMQHQNNVLRYIKEKGLEKII
ncbi:MAG: GntR family transcriptional regulator [Thermoplasmataceae archaeon]|jgi:DNA-binding GntR family transcriptional regulator